jgi:hypothetical protein
MQGTQAAVQVNLSTQLLTICHTLHTLLEAAGDGAAALRLMDGAHTQPHPPPQPFRLGTDFRVHSPKPAPPQSHPKTAPTTWRLSPLAVSQAFMAAHGFSLRVAPSACRQPEAGNGVWLQGTAALGQVQSHNHYQPLCSIHVCVWINPLAFFRICVCARADSGALPRRCLSPAPPP